jgi:hypothetical protein
VLAGSRAAVGVRLAAAPAPLAERVADDGLLVPHSQVNSIGLDNFDFVSRQSFGL